ncbi:hypothetical protein RI129_000007, partial [Pyrocoelia pectoralis]
LPLFKDLPEMENEAEGSDCEHGEKEDEKELDDIAEDVVDTSIAEDVADTSIGKSKNLSKPTFFRVSIRKGVTPGKSLCTECIEKYPVLSSRSWSDVKFFVYNHIKKVNKKNNKCH